MLRFRSSPTEIPYAVGNRDNKGEETVASKVKFKSVDLSTFFDKSVPAYEWPGQVTLNDREPIDRSDDGPWGGEVRV